MHTFWPTLNISLIFSKFFIKCFGRLALEKNARSVPSPPKEIIPPSPSTESMVPTRFDSFCTDTAVAVAVEFSGGRLATFALSSVVKLPGVAEIIGKKGKITLHPPFHGTTCVESPAGKFEIQLPPTSVPHNFPNTSGLRYQAEEVRRCLREGLLESPTMTHHDSLLIAEMLDEILKQIGVEF
ncbi:hypothetical protein MRX96_045975 [Rhipicephalus microplus]